ncbi:hypothetical protein PIB30_046464 [Stylosanthes scabra]|uniref:Uncharacterized protein n=1 Tax=Stylosanthes scabra TaxID=79078 RepID=A0ABU6SH86_9FABA|nr:hypothetical protein [Stylosanthes scabra]
MVLLKPNARIRGYGSCITLWMILALFPAFEEVIPGVDNRFCVRHFYNNFGKRFPGLDLKQMMWRCTKATHWKD